MFLLRFHSNYSAPDKPSMGELSEILAALNVERCAVTDVDTLAGVIEASRTFPLHGIRVIAGMESEDRGTGDRLLFLARTGQGFQWLNGLSAKVSGQGPQGLLDLPTPDPEDLWVICNLPGSRLRSLVNEGNDREATALVRRYTDHFGRQGLCVALPPALSPEDLDAQTRSLSLGRERVPFITLGCREDTGEPLPEEALHRAYAHVPAVLSEAERVLEGCEFRWSLPVDHLPEIHPGRGLRPESFLWERCQRTLQERNIRRTRKVEQRLYREFHLWRANRLLDTVASVVQFADRTSMGLPVVRFGNPWLTSSYAGFLLGIHPVDVLALGLDPVEINLNDVVGIDINLLVGREDVPPAIRELQEIFGHEHVAVRRRRATERTSPLGEPSLFDGKEADPTETKVLPITQIVVSRPRWPEVLPYVISDSEFLETDLPPEVLRHLPLIRFHVRPNRLLTLIAESARVAALKGKHIGRSVPGREAFRFLSGSDGGRGTSALAIPGLSRRENYQRLRQVAQEEGIPAPGPEGFHVAVDRVARSMGSEAESPESRFHKMAFAEKLLTLAWIADSHPDLYYSALLSSEEMDSEHLQTAVAEAATRGVNVQTPDINLSEAKTVVTPEGLRLGLRCIRGIGPVISGEIVEKRQRGNYRSIEDLCRRTNRRLVNRSVLEQLSAIGALDSIHPDRDEHPFYIDRIFEGAPLKSETGSTQILLFEVKEGKPAKREPARPKTPFILRPLAGFEGFLGEFKHEKVLALGRGRVRGTVCAGWFVEIFAPNPPLIPPYQGGQGEGPTTAFLTDGETTTPVVLAKNVPSPLLRTACLVRGIAGGLDKRISLMRLLRRRRAPGRPDPPPWLRDLPVFYVSDWEPLSDVLAEADLGARVSVSLSATGKETLRALEECFRALATRSARYRSFSVVAADAAPLPRRAGNLKKIRPLPVSLTVRWLQEIPGVSRVEVEKPAANESQTTDG